MKRLRAYIEIVLGEIVELAGVIFRHYRERMNR